MRSRTKYLVIGILTVQFLLIVMILFRLASFEDNYKSDTEVNNERINNIEIDIKKIKNILLNVEDRIISGNEYQEIQESIRGIKVDSKELQEKDDYIQYLKDIYEFRVTVDYKLHESLNGLIDSKDISILTFNDLELFRDISYYTSDGEWEVDDSMDGTLYYSSEGLDLIYDSESEEVQVMILKQGEFYMGDDRITIGDDYVEAVSQAMMVLDTNIEYGNVRFGEFEINENYEMYFIGRDQPDMNLLNVLNRVEIVAVNKWTACERLKVLRRLKQDNVRQHNYLWADKGRLYNV